MYLFSFIFIKQALLQISRISVFSPKIIIMKKLLTILSVALLLSSCNSWKFIGEYDHDVNFSKFKTFGLLTWDPHNDKEVSPKIKKYILLSIKDQLEARGYVYQKDNAELLVSVFILVTEETSYSAYANHYAGYSGYGSVGIGVGIGSGGTSVGVVGYGMPTTYPYTVMKHDYNVGTVVVDVLNSATKRIVWQGVATGRTPQEESGESKVQKDVNRLFLTFPKKKVKR